MIDDLILRELDKLEHPEEWEDYYTEDGILVKMSPDEEDENPELVAEAKEIAKFMFEMKYKDFEDEE